jgi:hypothetical protein
MGLFQWERFITPSIIKLFYWLLILFILLTGGVGIFSAAQTVLLSPINGGIVILTNLVGMMAGIVFARMVSEFVLITFRINEHLGAIRGRGGM